VIPAFALVVIAPDGNWSRPASRRWGSERITHGEALVDDDSLLVTVRVGAVTEMPIVVDRVSVFSALVVLPELPPCVSA
jgi:hypothetical protein